MAKGQKRSNREKKKPKAAALKAATPVAVEPRSFKYNPARIGAKRT
ncbi:MAG: hypothetical protein KBA31_09050 [Alphaproteobacteria bacterium]|nr:hypothetical protein [Alphaproteobacteria bacterium]